MLEWMEERTMSSLEVSGTRDVTDIVGIDDATKAILKDEYSISTIHDLVGYVLYNGYPPKADLCDETKFVLAIRTARTFDTGTPAAGAYM